MIYWPPLTTMCFLNNLLNVYVKHKRCRQIVSIYSSDLSSYYLRLCQKSAELNLGLVFGFCWICPEARSTENAKFWPSLFANLRTFHILFTGANNAVAYQKWQISGIGLCLCLCLISLVFWQRILWGDGEGGWWPGGEATGNGRSRQPPSEGTHTGVHHTHIIHNTHFHIKDTLPGGVWQAWARHFS